MNAYQRKRNRAAALLLTAALMAAPACAFALETSPLVPCSQQANAQAEKMPAFDRSRGFMGLTASDEWLKQARVGGIMLDVRVHTQTGEEIVFQENLGPAKGEEGKMCLSLMAISGEEDLVLQIDQDAIDTLLRMSVTEIAVANRDRDICGYYSVQELSDLRAALSLGREELLCVGGEDDPITVVSAEGVRRLITQ